MANPVYVYISAIAFPTGFNGGAYAAGGADGGGVCCVGGQFSGAVGTGGGAYALSVFQGVVIGAGFKFIGCFAYICTIV